MYGPRKENHPRPGPQGADPPCRGLRPLPSRQNYPPTETDTLKGWHGLQEIDPAQSHQTLQEPQEDHGPTNPPPQGRRLRYRHAEELEETDPHGGPSWRSRPTMPGLRPLPSRQNYPIRRQRISVRVRKDDAAHTTEHTTEHRQDITRARQ